MECHIGFYKYDTESIYIINTMVFIRNVNQEFFRVALLYFVLPSILGVDASTAQDTNLTPMNTFNQL